MADKSMPVANSNPKPNSGRITIQLPEDAKPLIDQIGTAIRKAVMESVGVEADLSNAKVVMAVLKARVRELSTPVPVGE